jgi:2-polyprenyl-6-methoxyphenol hydroxylase-like FAD-dependent oxidoreductase
LTGSSFSSGSGRAVVIGGSVAGLLAARALSPSFASVTVFDRDVLPASPAPRRGAPQTRQVHALLTRGAQGLEHLFPGFLDGMVAAGVPTVDAQADFSLYLDGHRMAEAVSGLISYSPTRPLLEFMIRERVAALPNVTVSDGADVISLVSTGGQVTGVQVRRRDSGAVETVPADLVVDAGGRGSRVLAWLGELGYPLPAETTVRPDVVYVTRHYRRDPAMLGGRTGANVAPYPGHPRSAVVVRQEGDQFAVMLGGMLGEEPPTDDAGMAAFAATLHGHEVAEVVREAVPLDEAVKMRYPQSTLRHFAKMDSRPGGFLVVGDALCSFNPVYGQGMTVAVMEAELLESLLVGGRDDLPARFFSAAADLLAVPWALAVGGDLRFPEIEGERGPQHEEINAYLTAYRAAAAVDPVLGTAFRRVANIMEPAETLFSPELVERVKAALASAAD